MGHLDEDLLDALRKNLKGRVVYVGIGSILRGDDGAGPELAERMRRKGALSVDAGTVPENHIGSICRLDPDTILIMDATHLDREPGSVELLSVEEIAADTGFTTHSLSPAMVMERMRGESGADIYLLAIQPQSLEFGSSLSEPVLSCIDALEGILPVRE